MTVYRRLHITWPLHDPKKLATQPATLLRKWCGGVSLRLGVAILKHFAALSPKMMLRSLPEVVRSSKNDKTFDYGTSSCLTLAKMHGAAEELQEARSTAEEPRSRAGEARSTAGGPRSTAAEARSTAGDARSQARMDGFWITTGSSCSCLLLCGCSLSFAPGRLLAGLLLWQEERGRTSRRMKEEEGERRRE